ncbi:MAG: protein-disulfide reductase DsbD domain-containing protein [Gemmatimonadaceae bacterium]
MNPTSICLLAAAMFAACSDPKPAETLGETPNKAVPATRQPVKWTISPTTAKVAGGETTFVRIDLSLQAGWHVYAVTQPVAGPTGGPMPTRITVPSNQPFALAGEPKPTSKPEVKFDDAFGMNVQQHDESVGFDVPVLFTKSSTPADSLHVNVRYQVCNAKLCYPPQTVKLATAVRSSGE